MFKLLGRMFLASITEDDEEKIRTVRVFNAISMAALVLMGLMAFGAVFIFMRKEAVAASVLLMLVFLFISAALARRGRVTLASAVLVSALWSIFSVSIWFSGGLNTVLSGSYTLCIVMAGILMGPRAAFVVAGVSTAAGLGLVVLPMLGLNPPQYYPLPPLSAWILLALNAFLMALAMWFGLKDLNEAVSTSRQTAKELETAYEALQERIETERTLQQTERKQQEILDNIEEGYYEVDLAGNMVFCNDSMVRILGYSRDELIGKNNREYMDKETSRTVYRTFNSVFTSGKPVSVTGWTLQRKGGGERNIEVSVSLLRDPKGEPSGFFGIARDVTERERLHEQHIQAQKMEAIGTLAGGIAHDFNNLLQVISGNAEVALFDLRPGNSGYSELLEIKAAARSAAELTQGLLTFSRETRSRLKPVDLNEELHQVAKMLSRTVPKMIEIKMNLAEDLYTVKADPTQLQQVVMNLAVNARDAMAEGGQLFIETRNICLDEEYTNSHLGTEPGRYVLLSMTDTGDGMDEETKQHIFDPFYTTKETGKGTGLGLSVVYGIVKNHGGNINCYSEPGQGTTFKIYLPTIEQAHETIELDQTKDYIGGNETILLVDDEASVRKLGESILRKFGYSVLTASNGREGLEMFRQRLGCISLVILDLIMPEMDGKQCLKKILTIDPSIKVLIASGFAANGQIEAALEEGAKASIRKPYEADQMLALVRRILDET